MSGGGKGSVSTHSALFICPLVLLNMDLLLRLEHIL